MSPAERKPSADEQLLQSVIAEARDFITRLEGSSVQRLSVAAGDCKIEIERGAQAAPAGVEQPAPIGSASGVFALGAGSGLGVAPGARAASGAFTAITDGEPDNRIPVLAPLVGTFYAAAQPGAKPFVEKGDVVEMGQTVCIVEAMKLMNEVAAAEGGKVAEIVVSDGEPVEFEQVLMYLEPASD